MSDIFKKLSAINVNEHVQKKMNLSYLSWAFAWGELQKAYPESSYIFHPVEFYPDASCEVSVSVTVENVTRDMFLPVMDHKNNAIKSPNARQISDAKMRCLVKCIAMFGLGLYIYAGEDLPQLSEETIKEQEETLHQEWINAIHKCETEASLGGLYNQLDADGKRQYNEEFSRRKHEIQERKAA